jgi:hypothetical protein
MGELAEARCCNHAHREAAARCPACGRHFCRECVTEHDRRLLCAECLQGLAAVGAQRAWRLGGPGLWAGALVGLFALWVCFYLAGQALLLIPSSVHEGTWWETLWQGRQ